MFGEVLGHKKILELLSGTIRQGNPSHAYVFYGKEGVGKRLVAFEFAKQLLNTDNLQSNVDFKYVARLEGKQDILVEQIRDEVTSDVYIAPALGKYKIYIIDDADKMNESSQNALLKTLEEPPKSVIVILITNNIGGLLETILSRTTNIFFEPLTDDEIREYMKREKISLNESMIEFASGSISILNTIADEKNKDVFDTLNNIVEQIKRKDVIQLINSLKDVDLKRELSIQYLEYLLLKENMYDKVSLIEQVAKSIMLNANEDMQKTKLAIELVRN